MDDHVPTEDPNAPTPAEMRTPLQKCIDSRILEFECEVLGPGATAEDIHTLTDWIISEVREQDHLRETL